MNRKYSKTPRTLSFGVPEANKMFDSSTPKIEVGGV
jgi:hypothetical protein